jgi:hypothetical protein
LREKLCHYCGKDCKNLTREHFLPQKLMDITGDKNRVTNLVRLPNGREVTDNLPKMYLWACKECHDEINRISDDEGIRAVEAILAGGKVSVPSIKALLNLFDKMRTGYWIYYHKMKWEEPEVDVESDWLSRIFPIKDRIGSRDRSLYVAKAPRGSKGLTTFGVCLPIFDYTPCSFAVSINDYLFVSSSAPFFLHKNFGMTCPKNQTIDPTGIVGFEIPSLRLDRAFHPAIPPGANFVKIFEPVKPKDLWNGTVSQYYSMASNEAGLESMMNALLGGGDHIAIDVSGNMQIFNLDESFDFGWLEKNEFRVNHDDIERLIKCAQVEVCSIYDDEHVKEIVEFQKTLCE